MSKPDISVAVVEPPREARPLDDEEIAAWQQYFIEDRSEGGAQGDKARLFATITALRSALSAAQQDRDDLNWLLSHAWDGTMLIEECDAKGCHPLQIKLSRDGIQRARKRIESPAASSRPLVTEGPQTSAGAETP